MRITVILTLSIICFLACEQESLTNLSTNCLNNHTIPEHIEKDSLFPTYCANWPFPVILSDRYQYYHPSFNPNNENEIAFGRWDVASGGSRELWKFNFCTGESTFLASGITTKSDWSVKDWIIFMRVNGNIWKIKSNGDSLTQLTFDNGLKPQWDDSGERFLYSINGGHLIIADENGATLDTLHDLRGPGKFAWMNDTTVLSTLDSSLDNHGVGYYNINSKEYKHIDRFEYLISSYSNVNSIAWLESEQSIVWNSIVNISKTNIHTQERILLNETNPIWHYYRSVDVSSDGNTLVIYGDDMENIDGCSVRRYNRIYLMDADGSNERYVEFPE